MDKYCSTHGSSLYCDCENPRMVHQCGFGNCGVEIYNKDEMCDRHTANVSFIKNGGPSNIIGDTDKIQPGFWHRFWYGKG